MLQKQYAAETANTLHRMLWGYTNKDLAGGQDRELVERLDHESLAVRRLAFWNLMEITGLGLYYVPEETVAKRKTPIQKWRQRLQAGEIRLGPNQ